jgi:3-isopropylmalate/(R)-2-methylmalate dehydratase small subunit
VATGRAPSPAHDTRNLTPGEWEDGVTERVIESRVVTLLRDDIDTDQIIPVRFMDRHDDATMAQGLFANWRAADPEFPLHHDGPPDARILVVGENFGCGSSREHAVWALKAYGFRVVVAASYADIFFDNALQNGLVPVSLGGERHERFIAAIRERPSTRVAIDVRSAILTTDDGTFSAGFELSDFRRMMLASGHDDLGLLRSATTKREEYLASPRRHWSVATRLHDTLDLSERMSVLTVDDRLAIQELYARYCHAIDGGEADVWASLFTDDGVVIAGVRLNGRDELRDYAIRRIAATKEAGIVVQHWNSNLVVTAADGRVTGSCYLMRVERQPGAKDVEVGRLGRYSDVLVKVGEDWRFAQRELLTT